MTTVRRFDAATLGEARRTPQGFLRVPARLTRTGVLEYRRADGTVRRELRRPEQVFSPASLETLSDAPVTDLHPAQKMVTPDNASELSVGHVSHATVRRDQRFVEGELVITNAKMIAAVESGKRREVSCGYACKLLEQPGEWDGERYDAEQIYIRYNHAGLGPQKWGRAGSECAVRLDAEDALVIDADDPSDPPPPLPPKPKEPTMELVTIRIDGIDAQVPKQSAQLIEQALSKRDTEIAKVTKEAGDNKARLDTLQGELDGTKKKLTEATDPKRLDSAIAERVVLQERARKVLGAEFKFDGKTPREIKEACLKKVEPELKLDGKSDEYVQGRFDSIDESRFDQDDDNDGGIEDDLDNARRATSGPSQQRRDSNTSLSKPSLPPWQRPLTATRNG